MSTRRDTPLRQQCGEIEIEIIVCVVVAVIFFFLGFASMDSGWREDCRKIGAHVAYSGATFQCSEQK